jgi:hypothetical protein
MLGLLNLIPDIIKLPAAMILGAALAFYPVRWLGQSEGKQMAATAALSKSVQVLRERNTINDEVSVSDAAALCRDLGLSADDTAECVRRLDPVNAKPDNVGNDPQDGQTICEPSRKP